MEVKYIIIIEKMLKQPVRASLIVYLLTSLHRGVHPQSCCCLSNLGLNPKNLSPHYGLTSITAQF